jgi:hypothetical protein
MDWARDFDSNFVLKIEGILDVFQDFYKQKLEQKTRPRRKKEFLEVPISLRGAKRRGNPLRVPKYPGDYHAGVRYFVR